MGKRYKIGDVGAGSHVVQGDNNTWVEEPWSKPGGGELGRQLDELLARIGSEPGLDEDSRQLATEKTQAVAAALSRAAESPDELRKALRDARVFLTSTAGSVWDGLRKVLESAAAQETISSIAEGGTRAAIQALIGLS